MQRLFPVTDPPLRESYRCHLRLPGILRSDVSSSAVLAVLRGSLAGLGSGRRYLCSKSHFTSLVTCAGAEHRTLSLQYDLYSSIRSPVSPSISFFVTYRSYRSADSPASFVSVDGGDRFCWTCRRSVGRCGLCVLVERSRRA